MRKIKEVVRLKWGLGLSARQVGASLRISHSTVGECLKRAEQAGLDWAHVEGMIEAAIAEQLFPPKKANRIRAEPDWAEVDIELQRKGVTRMLLWQEYLEEYPDGYSYSQFCERYRKWQKSAEKTTMREPGLFADSPAQINSLEARTVLGAQRFQARIDPLLQGIAFSFEIIERGTDENTKRSGCLCHIYPLFLRTWLMVKA